MIRLSAEALGRALAAALPFASTDSTRAALHGVMLRTDAGSPSLGVLALATDGHTVGAARVATLPLAGAGVEIFLPYDLARTVLTELRPLITRAAASRAAAQRAKKGAKADEAWRRVAAATAPEAVIVEDVTEVRVTLETQRWRAPVVKETFPPVDRYLAIVGAMRPAVSVDIDPRYLARACEAATAFGGVRGEAPTMTMGLPTSARTDERNLDPIVFEATAETTREGEIGRFAAIVMPRVGGAQGLASNQIERLTHLRVVRWVGEVEPVSPRAAGGGG